MKTNGWFARRQIAGARCIRETRRRRRSFKVARLMENPALPGPFVSTEFICEKLIDHRSIVHRFARWIRVYWSTSRTLLKIGKKFGFVVKRATERTGRAVGTLHFTRFNTSPVRETGIKPTVSAARFNFSTRANLEARFHWDFSDLGSFLRPNQRDFVSNYDLCRLKELKIHVY